MLGKILNYDFSRGQGIISGEDGKRYNFVGGEFKAQGKTPRVGGQVDFTAYEDVATEIYPVMSNSLGDLGDKNKIVAALLAFFLGGLGIHKFYLGKTTAGIIMLICGTIGWLLILPGLAMAIIAFIEFIIYLTKDDQQFYDEYVVGDKAWF